MIDSTINPKRIRSSAPIRKSMSLTEEDMQRLSYLEKTFTNRFPDEAPFTFSKTVSKAVELAYLEVLKPVECKDIQMELTPPADKPVNSPSRIGKFKPNKKR